MKNKVTIITPTSNSAGTIIENLTSVKNQNYDNWEQIIIDNKSSDETLELIKKNSSNKIRIISEKDNGIYDAINKGINLAEGEIISILHSDDVYFSNNILSQVIQAFSLNDVDIVYGNLLYVSKNNLKKVIRYWRSRDFKNGIFSKGWSPPHPTFFVKKKIHDNFGYYNPKLGNPADIELMYRFLEEKKVKSKYLNEILIKMRYGGKSNSSLIQIVLQNLQILKILKLKNPLNILKFIYFKTIDRALQLINKY